MQFLLKVTLEIANLTVLLVEVNASKQLRQESGAQNIALPADPFCTAKKIS